MQQINAWHVGLVGESARAYARNAAGECFSLIQQRAGGAWAAMRFRCPEDVFARLQAGAGEPSDADVAKIEFCDAIALPPGLEDALFALGGLTDAAKNR